MTTAARQLTVPAVVLAIILAAVLAAANAYLGLFAGMTIASAIPSAVVSMAVLRALGGGGILENNIVQTGGSAGGSVTSGVIFTVPALVILGYWQSFHFWWGAGHRWTGGHTGCAVLRAPAPLADLGAAAQLSRRSGGRRGAAGRREPREGLKVLGSAAAASGLAKLAAASGLKLIPDTAFLSGYVGKAAAYVGTNLSAALLGVGYIVGFNIGVVSLAGSVLSWNIVMPIYMALFLDPHDNPKFSRHGRCRCSRHAMVAPDPLPGRWRHGRGRCMDPDQTARLNSLGHPQWHGGDTRRRRRRGPRS